MDGRSQAGRSWRVRETLMPRRLIQMAIVYDFDGTLAPGNIQERQFIPDVGMTPDDFWAGVDRLSEVHQADGILMYMYEMLKKADEARVPVRREDFRAGSHDIELFEGVRDWFDRVNKYGRAEGVRLEHYIVSSGNAEIIEGTPIAPKFAKIYASRFLFDQNGVAVWPALAINYTTKTQYLFRINKGAHDLSDNTAINRYVEKKDRPVPFENMVYIGDGVTDVPCFRLVKDQGGLSIAVYRPHTRNAREKAETFVRDGRVRCAVPANYTEGGELDRLVHDYIKLIAAREPFA
jgi:2-hydroxy-3-keto-5-methylthiopentenyl-1-phosphate phosphatase